MNGVRTAPSSSRSIPRRSAMHDEPTRRKSAFDTVPEPTIVPAAGQGGAVDLQRSLLLVAEEFGEARLRDLYR